MSTDLTRRTLRWLFALPSLIIGLQATEPPALPAPTNPADIPVEYFFRSAAVAGAALNPAGTHVGMRVYDAKHDSYGLIFLNLASRAITGSRGDSTYNIFSFNWAGDDRVVFTVTHDVRFARGLYAMNRDDPKKITTLNEYEAVDVLGSPRSRPENLFVLVRQSWRHSHKPTGLFEIDLRKNFRNNFGDFGRNVVRSFNPPPGIDGVMHWWRDRQGEIAYLLAYHKGVRKLFRHETDDRWTAVQINVEHDAPMAIDSDPAVLLVGHRNGQGLRELRRFNTIDGSLGPVLHTDEKYDFSVGSIRFSTDDRDLSGLLYARQAPEQVWFRDEDAALQQTLDRLLPPERVNLITSRSRDGQRVLVVGSSDRHPGSLYLFDRGSKKLTQLADLAPWLPERLMAPVRLMTFQTRDGLKLDGYVTLPLSHQEGRPAPMVVLPHGGPWVRDVWGYDAQSQFFASRGYLVFRPNYRGSSGYDAAISQAPRMEFRTMHDDVTDGVHALIDAKIADPARIAILGSSFGGYLAMCGAAFEPGLYKCAVSIAGVFDWAEFMEEDRDLNSNTYRYEWFRRELGDPEKDREKFVAMSPLHSVAKIKVPVFVAHGKEDTNADTDQSRRLVKALKDAGVPYEALFIPGEAHGFAELKHRIDLYTRIEAFLKRNL
ncbi:MAG: S9 family peptidase [Opitutae bacterium]|nr:S9 family peptidase [Opitutae bacterium]